MRTIYLDGNNVFPVCPYRWTGRAGDSLAALLVGAANQLRVFNGQLQTGARMLFEMSKVRGALDT